MDFVVLHEMFCILCLVSIRLHLFLAKIPLLVKLFFDVVMFFIPTILKNQ